MNSKVILTILISAIYCTGICAQESKKDKKVIVITKKNENGKITETKKEAVGEEAEILINSLETDNIEHIRIETPEKDKTTIRITEVKKEKKMTSPDKKDIEKEIEISSSLINGTTKERYKIIKKDGDSEKIYEWDGQGPMPSDMEDILGNININKNTDGEHMTITIDAEEMEREQGGRMIVEKNKDLKNSKTYRFDRNEERPLSWNRSGKYEMNSEKTNENKVTLGVMIDNTDNGVVIADIVDGSAAALGGLRRGDVILKINDRYIFTSKGLLEALRPFNPNEKAKIRYIREGKEKSTSVTLKARQ